jgi:glycosyltransferase involved in cell wall biosynthesis
MSPHRPRVSIAMPVYNAADTIDDALQSALNQTYENLEILVVDNASTDGTPDIVRSYDDPRIVLHENATNIGPHKNGNRSVQLSNGGYVKFLHADDALYPACVERMVEVMERSERVGMVFARRRIEIGDETDPDMVTFREIYQDAQKQFGELGEVNDGRRMLSRWLEDSFSHNWVGEQSSVMMRREALQRLGLFNPRVRMLTDVEMWARAMFHYDIGFVDAELSTYRFHAENLTITQGKMARWLDRLWLLEGLAETPEARIVLPKLLDAIAAERLRVAKVLVRASVKHPMLMPHLVRDAAHYASFVARRGVGHKVPLHPALAPAPAFSELSTELQGVPR